MNNIFDAIPKNIDAEIFEKLVESEDIKIERIISKGHISEKNFWYDQDEDEWVMILQGAAILLFEEGPSIKLEVGDYINIPAHKKHKVEWTASDIETIWLAVHYKNRISTIF